MKSNHFLIAFMPAQGHINPSLQLAKNLARGGAKVTLATTHHALKQIKHLPTLKGLSYVSLDEDGEDDVTQNGFSGYLEMLRGRGPLFLTNLLANFSAEGQPVTLLVYGLLLPWVGLVARQLQIQSAFLFSQCATVFTIFLRFFNSLDGVHGLVDSSVSIKLPALPLFSSKDLPSYLLQDDPWNGFMVPLIQQHIRVLEEDPTSFLLVNTFEELEQESIRYITNIKVFSVGPLIPSAFSDGIDLADKSFGADLFSQSEDYFQWLDSKLERSVIYVSFGSLAVLKKEQKEEILHALVESGRPFLWVLRSSNSEEEEEEEEEVNKMIENGANRSGIIVPWCSQVEVLSHRSIGCFVTHCGWNSTFESMVSGVPMIACPQASDQMTNAKLVEEVWGIGVQARANEESIIEKEEIKKCLDIVMGDGDGGETIREKTGKLRGLAIEAVKEGGSTYNNLKNLLMFQDIN